MQQNIHQNPDFSHIIHSNGYAREQHEGIGSTSRETFDQRLAVDRSRGIISRYKGLPSMQTRNRAQSIERLSFRKKHMDTPQSTSQATTNASKPSQAKKHTFTEPTGRRYNPYS